MEPETSIECRGSTRPLPWLAGLAALGGAALYLGSRFDLATLYLLGGVTLVVTLPLMGAVLPRKVVFDRYGLTVYRSAGPAAWMRPVARVAWSEVAAVQVVESGLDTGLRIRRRRGRPLPLPAPRSFPGGRDRTVDASIEQVRRLWRDAGGHGELDRVRQRVAAPAMLVAVLLAAVLAMMVYLDAPWHRTWWPGTSYATATPDPCRVLDADTVGRLGLPATGSHDGDLAPSDGERTCSWSTRRASLDLRYQRFAYDRYSDGTADAADFYHHVSQQSPPGGRFRPLPGIGDEAHLWVGSAGMATGYARLANTVVTVEYLGPTGGRTRADLAAVARIAVAAIPIRTGGL